MKQSHINTLFEIEMAEESVRQAAEDLERAQTSLTEARRWHRLYLRCYEARLSYDVAIEELNDALGSYDLAEAILPPRGEWPW